MLKASLGDFKQTDMMRPYFMRGKATLSILLSEVNQHELLEQLVTKYKDITLENTIKVLLRCKLQFHTRDLLLQIFKEIMVYEAQAGSIKDLLTTFKTYKVTLEDD